jgi:hypothetical protein
VVAARYTSSAAAGSAFSCAVEGNDTPNPLEITLWKRSLVCKSNTVFRWRKTCVVGAPPHFFEEPVLQSLAGIPGYTANRESAAAKN